MMAATHMTVPSDPPNQAHATQASGEQALGDWVESHQTWLWRYLRFLSAPADVAEDICQDTLIAALQHQIPERDHRTAIAWLRTTARNLFHRHFRGIQQRAALHQMLARDAEVTEADLLREASDEHQRALLACLAELPEHGRQVLDLRYRVNASRKDIAAKLGRSEEGTKTMLRRIKQTLRECIERQGTR